MYCKSDHDCQIFCFEFVCIFERVAVYYVYEKGQNGDFTTFRGLYVVICYELLLLCCRIFLIKIILCYIAKFC